MTPNAPATIQDGPGTARGGGSHERITVNLTEKASEALASAVLLSRDSKTDCINKALLLYELLHQVQNSGGAVYLREGPTAEVERLRVL
jgi:hypothetical protein